jgi:hypothetical protein
VTDRPGDAPQSGPYVYDPVTCQHVAESRRLILAAAESAHPGQAIVLGGGRCAEIPLAELLERFQRVTLNDLDRDAVEEGLKLANLSDAARGKLQLHLADLTGSNKAIVASLAEAIREASDCEGAIEAMSATADRVSLAGLPIDGKYDLIVASCVLSQLHTAVLNGAYEAFVARFPDQQDTLRNSPRWMKAMYGLARRIERKFIDDLPARLTPGGYLYLSDSTQVCFVELTPDGRWRTEGKHRLLRTPNLGDYFDSRFAPIARDRWYWVAPAPNQSGETGRLYDVQAFVLRTWRI